MRTNRVYQQTSDRTNKFVYYFSLLFNIDFSDVKFYCDQFNETCHVMFLHFSIQKGETALDMATSERKRGVMKLLS